MKSQLFRGPENREFRADTLPSPLDAFDLIPKGQQKSTVSGDIQPNFSSIPGRFPPSQRTQPVPVGRSGQDHPAHEMLSRAFFLTHHCLAGILTQPKGKFYQIKQMQGSSASTAIKNVICAAEKTYTEKANDTCKENIGRTG